MNDSMKVYDDEEMTPAARRTNRNYEDKVFIVGYLIICALMFLWVLAQHFAEVAETIITLLRVTYPALMLAIMYASARAAVRLYDKDMLQKANKKYRRGL